MKIIKKHLNNKDFLKVEKPARYIGGEWNITKKKFKKTNCQIAFCFPDVYEIGMSYLGLHILYSLINETTNYLMERVFCPWPDMIDFMKEKKIPLYSLESYTPLNKFPIVGFTLQYEMHYTNILKMLNLGKIPLNRKDRLKGNYPIIIAGGPCAINPEPISDFFDVFLIGDGEELLVEFMKKAEKFIKNGYIKNRKKFLNEIKKIKGVYIPELYNEVYDSDIYMGIIPINLKDKKKIKKAIIKDLNNVHYPSKTVIPFVEATHDRMMLEILRGCTHGCRFCQAGMLYRPVRERKTNILIKQAKILSKNTGYDEISLISLSSLDHSNIDNLIDKLIKLFKKDKIGVSLPSSRINSFSIKIARNIQKIKKTGFTFAPEAGTQKMRDIINKGVTEKELFKTIKDVFKSGWKKIKLYFMIGLPEEKDEDVIAIANIAKKIVKISEELKIKNASIIVSVSSFIPKTFTPFQWCGQNSYHELIRKQMLLFSNLKNKKIKFKYHDAKMSLVEALLARGDRALNKVLIEAYKQGCIFDSWNEYFDFNKWIKACKKCNIKIENYSQKRFSYNENLPWDHIDIGINKKYFWNEYKLSKKGLLTPDCRKKCNNCKLCKNRKVKMNLERKI